MGKINFKQPKYIIPLLALPFLLLIGYVAKDFFSEKKGKNERVMSNTKEINIQLPEANVKETTKTKLEALKEVYKKSADFAAIQNIERDDNQTNIADITENSLYTQEEINKIDSLNRISQLGKQELKDEFQLMTSNFNPKKHQGEVDNSSIKNISGVEETETDADKEMKVFKEQMRYIDSLQNPEKYEKENNLKEKLFKVDVQRTTRKIAQAEKINRRSRHFNTVEENKQRNVITAMVDENITVFQGSRVRIKLLDDIMVENIPFKKGDYLFGTVSGFGAERVKISVNSIMVDAEHYELELSVFDIDGLEGLYVPNSSFRDFSKDLGRRSTSQNFQSGNESDIAPAKKFAVDLMKNVYQGAAQAVGRNISKRKALLKYNTRLYLINKKKK